MRHLQSIVRGTARELVPRGSVIVAALLAAVATGSAQRASSPGLLETISTHAKTFAADADFPAVSGSPTIDRGTNRITLRGQDSHLTVLAGPKTT